METQCKLGSRRSSSSLKQQQSQEHSDWQASTYKPMYHNHNYCMLCFVPFCLSLCLRWLIDWFQHVLLLSLGTLSFESNFDLFCFCVLHSFGRCFFVSLVLHLSVIWARCFFLHDLLVKYYVFHYFLYLSAVHALWTTFWCISTLFAFSISWCMLGFWGLSPTNATEGAAGHEVASRNGWWERRGYENGGHETRGGERTATTKRNVFPKARALVIRIGLGGSCL